MFIVRSVSSSDLDQVYELSQLMKFINIPDDHALLKKKIEHSNQSFDGKLKKEDSIFIFVLEDINTEKVIGVSLIHGLHGTEEEPHFFLTVGQENKYSQSLNTGFIHGTLKFGHTTKGFTEIGGLILDPAFRGNPFKLGKALSFARFIFIGENKHLFTKNIHVELMPPFDQKGKSPLWEALGRKFLNMDYKEADILSRKNKEFILSLFPQDTVYETLLPLKARDAIGKVGEETQPVKRMLSNIGFRYTKEVDPFDGGPHYRADIEDISVIKELKTYHLQFDEMEGKQLFLLQTENKEHPFFSPIIKGKIKNHSTIQLNKKYKSLFSKPIARGFMY